MKSTGGLPTAERLLAFVAISLSITAAVLNGAIVNVALPVIAHDLHADPAGAIWVVNAYQLVLMISLLPLASLGEILGYRRVYLGGLAVFTVASLACAFSDTLLELCAARTLQGLGAAGVMSVNMALVRFIYPPHRLGQGVGNMALVVGIASAAGPTAAAAILSVAAWPWLFLAAVPLGLLAFGVALWTLPETPRREGRFDWTSAAMHALTFGLLISGIDLLRQSDGFALACMTLAAAALMGIVFVRRQTTLPTPLLPVDLLRSPVFGLSIATSVCSFAAQALALVSLPFYFYDELGRSAVATGLLLAPWPLAIAVMAPIAGRLADHRSPGMLCSVGLAVLAAGLVLVTLLPTDPSAADIIWRLAACGFGFALFQSPNNRDILSASPRESSGGASGMLPTARLLGQTIGAALAGMIFGVLIRGPIEAALLLAAALSLIGCALSGIKAMGETGAA